MHSCRFTDADACSRPHGAHMYSCRVPDVRHSHPYRAARPTHHIGAQVVPEGRDLVPPGVLGAAHRHALAAEGTQHTGERVGHGVRVYPSGKGWCAHKHPGMPRPLPSAHPLTCSRTRAPGYPSSAQTIKVPYTSMPPPAPHLSKEESTWMSEAAAGSPVAESVTRPLELTAI